MSVSDKNSLDLYGADWCGDCIRVKFVLDNFGISYNYIDIDKNENDVQKVISLNEKVHNRATRSIPVLVFEDDSVLIEPSSKQLYKKLQEFNLISE